MASLVTVDRAGMHPAAARLDATALGKWLEAASDWVKLYCGRTFTATLQAEVHDGDGTSVLYVHELPIVSLVDIKILEDDGDTETLDDEDFRYNAQTGEIRFQPDPDGDYSYFPRGFRNVTVDYNSGYAAVPEAVQEAVIEIALQVCAAGANPNDPSLASEKLGSYSYSIREAAQQPGGLLSPAARSALGMYRTYGRGS